MEEYEAADEEGEEVVDEDEEKGADEAEGEDEGEDDVRGAERTVDIGQASRRGGGEGPEWLRETAWD